ncbi:alkaline phosphatase family protein [Dysgonomonas sp. 216]|uniref:alkaline phosphatase family protein n=1 Tax=Dysgonomonas sp. 216 TaxID=2302934 RepID=UPI0013CF881E|nr:alkaline phosphatase family protein [Dysgonomonas sp. 216]NDW17786.1 alkaline phosphatase family protein [Dysgonomonas sp. 216]
MLRIITSLVAVLTVASIQSQTTLKETPKLVIGITIDQLRGDYLDLFQHTFTDKGFKRLLNEGLVYQNMSFDYANVSSASAIATIYTGTNPNYHGVTTDKKYSPSKNREVSSFDDEAYLGNYTKEKLSPLVLKVSSVVDELKLASQGYSEVYSFAPNAEQALASGGRMANCAFWLEEYSGRWATSTFYKDFHWSIDQENRSNAYSNDVASLVWKPIMDVSNYKAFPYTVSNASFQHTFPSFSYLKKSPLTNSHISESSLKLVEKADLGKRPNPDFLALTFYLGNYPGAADKNYSLEIQDAYAQLDRTLGDFLDKIDKTVGLKNTLIFVTSTGYFDAEEIYPADNKMAGGVFYTNRCEALLNMFLMAIYGDGQWVDKLYDNQIYLNRKLIKDKNLNLAEVQEKAAEFIVEFTGVQDAATSSQLLNGKANDNMTPYKNIYTKDVSGDIFIEIQPGYKIVDEQLASTAKEEKRVRQNAITAPVIFFGHHIKAEKIKRTIKATEIAPTVSSVLRIRSPNAARMQALPEFLQINF